MRLKFHSFDFIGANASLKAVFLHILIMKNYRVFEQAENQNVLDSAHEISFKLNGKCWRNYKLPSLVIILTSCYHIVVKSQVFIKNLK